MILTIASLVAIPFILSTCYSAPPGHRPSQLKIRERQPRPLFDAIGQQRVDIIRDLIAEGADVNETNPYQERPLNMAVAHPTPSLPLIIALLKGGAQIDWSVHFSAPHPNPSPESSLSRSPSSSPPLSPSVSDSETPTPTPPRSPVASDSDHSAELTPQILSMHIKMPLQTAAEKHNETLVKELYRRGAYPLPQGIRERLPRPIQYILEKYEPIAHERVTAIHSVLSPALKKNRDLEEIIRIMEISPKKEGKDYYWTIASDSTIPRTTAEAGPPIGTGSAKTVSS